MISTNESYIAWIGGGKVVGKTNVVGKKSETEFFTLEARLTFAKLRQAFNTTPILNYLDLQYNIWIEINASSYVIGRILIQLTSNSLS